jgi:hypothetical protein
VIKKQWKPHFYKHKGPIEPDRTLLEMAVARELLTTWELTKNRELIEKHLGALDKLFGANAHLRIREYMKEIKRNER